MKKAIAGLCLAVIALMMLAPGALAGDVLDGILNYPVIDQKCPPELMREEGMGLVSQKKAELIVLSKEQPLGQTFTLGPKADRLWRAHVGLCHWPSDWQPGEEITFTLYDSPAKANKLFSRTLDYDHKWFKWDVVFDMNLPTKPGASYYFELTHNGAGDNSVRMAFIRGDTYPAGKPYVAGQPKSDFDLYFVAVTKPKGDRAENLKRLISHFDLENPALAGAKAAYAKGDLDGTCTLILRAFEDELRKADWIWRIKPDVKPDTARVDRLLADRKLYSTSKGKEISIPFDAGLTWREVYPGTAEYIRQNTLFAYLGQAYVATGDEKYAAKLNEFTADCVQDNTTPFEGGMVGGRWVAMHQAWRLGDAFDGMANALDAKSLTDDVKLAWIDYWYRIAEFAEQEHSGGNQRNAVAQALMEFAAHMPMYKGSKDRFARGFDMLVTNSLDLFNDDGGCREPAMNYHGFSLSNLLSGLETAAKFGLKPPDALMAKLEKALAYTAYIVEPNGHIPTYGDTDCESFGAADPLSAHRSGEALKGARMFGRYDMLYIATGGRRGTRPSETSRAFPLTGNYVMRSDWGGENGAGFNDARWLLMRGGQFASHGHEDMNAIALYAYGRPLLIDPGRTTYGTPLMFELTKNRSHNVLLVDDLPMNHPAPKLHAWSTTDAMDLVDNGYDELYPGVSQRRAVVFVRPDYYVVFDTAKATAPHRMGLNFWLTPPEVTIDSEAVTVHSNDPDGSNVLLKVMGEQGVEVTERKGTVDLRGERSDIPVVTFWQNGTANAQFATVIYPYPKGAAAPTLSADYAVRNGACVVDTPSGTDAIFCLPSSGAAVSGDRGSIQGRAGLIRYDKSGGVTRFALVDGTRIGTHAQALAVCKEPVAELSVEYLPDLVRVTCPVGAGVEIAALGRKAAVVNGKPTEIAGETFNVQ